MMKKYLFIIFLVLTSLALSGAFSYTYSAAPAPMTAYCQTPPVVTTAVQPNIMIAQDVSGSMAWCGYYAKAGNPNACDTNCSCSVSQQPCVTTADCTPWGFSGDTCPSSCGYKASVTYDGYFNPSKNYEQDSNDIWEEYSGSGACTAVCLTATCTGNTSGSGCSNAGKYGSKKGSCILATKSCTSSQYCCCTDTYQTGNCSNASSGNFLNYMHMARIDMLRWAMTGGTPASCATKPYTPANCDAELWQSSTAAGQVGASCTGSIAGTGCCGVNNLLNGDGVTQSGCVLTTNDLTSVKVPWSRIVGRCNVSSATNVTPALCAAANGTWTTSGGLAYTFMTLPLKPRMGLLAFEDTGTVDGIYIGDYTATGTVATDQNSISIPNYPYMNLITHLNSIPPNNGTPTAAAMWDVLNYFEQNTPKNTDSGQAVSYSSGGKFTGLAPSSTLSPYNYYRNPMYSCGNGGANCVFTPCAGNYAILLSDGGWNQPSCSIGTSPSCSSTTNADPVVPAYCMHQNFTNNVSSTQTKVNSVYTISLFSSFCSKSGGICQSNSDCTGGAGDTCTMGYGGTALENVAMYGSFNNAQKTWPSNLTGFPATSCTDSVDCSSTAKGSLCTAMPASSPDWDQDGNGVPDTAYTASSSSQIKNGILTAVQSILQQSTSGTAVSILASGQGSGANLLQAVFYPQMAFADAQVAWVGQLQNLWYYVDPNLKSSTVREDTVHDYILELKQDNVVIFTFDQTVNKSMADLWVDTSGTGSPLTFRLEENLNQLNNLWEAGYLLWARNEQSSPRTLYTSTTGSSLINFSTTNAATLQAYLQANSQTEAKDLITYISGIDLMYCTGTTTPCTSNSQCTSPSTCTLTYGYCSVSLTACTASAQCTGGSGDTCVLYRPRTAALSTSGTNSTDNVWKLGDIISSTPQLQAGTPINSYAQGPPMGYNDQTYSTYTQSQNYKNFGAVYAGANDGMFHAFTLGLLNPVNNPSDPFQIAELCDDPSPTGSATCPSGFTTKTLGTENWAYLPKNTLPYLRYFADPNYCHLFYVDAPPYIFDASINAPSTCAAGDYSLCPRQTMCTGNTKCYGSGSGNVLDLANTSWRTIVIGSMGTGGACSQTTSTCNGLNVCSQHPYITCTSSNVSTVCPSYSAGETCLSDCVLAPITDPSNSSASLGYSSYFALDVTNPSSPNLLWEFPGSGTTFPSSATLGFSTAAPAVLRVNGGAPASSSNNSTNGKWFVVLASGPTGPIDPASYQFLGSSDQDLMLYILDLKTGALLRTIDTGLANAFAGNLIGATVDTDRFGSATSGQYEDNLVYIPYTQKTSTGWQGGILRLTTGGASGEDSNVNNWRLSTLITVPGAITSGVSLIQDYNNHTLWVYFGTGRYFWKIGTNIDDANTQQAIYGVKDPCESDANVQTGTYDMVCTSSLSVSNLTNSTTTALSVEPAAGWYINLSASNSTNYAERVITNPLGASTGGVFFTTFAPSTSACGFSGNTYIWAVNYNTGGSLLPSALLGSAMVQVSTGQIQQVNLASVFTQNAPTGSSQGRKTTAFVGVPPKGQGMAVTTSPRPVARVWRTNIK